MQGQFEYTISINVADFAIGRDRSQRSVIRPATADDELSNPTGCINCRVGRLRRKALINMVMPVQNQVYIIIVQNLPDGLRVRRGAASRTIKRDVPIRQSTEICMSCQVRGK